MGKKKEKNLNTSPPVWGRGVPPSFVRGGGHNPFPQNEEIPQRLALKKEKGEETILKGKTLFFCVRFYLEEHHAYKDHTGLHGVQTPQLRLDKGQEDASRPDGIQQVLPVLQKAYVAQGNKVIARADPAGRIRNCSL